MDENSMIGINYYQIDSHLSKWCILERFKRIHHLYETSKFDCSKIFEELYQVNLIQRENKIREELFKQFIYPNPYHKTLRYCPICLGRGIHLYEHQALVYSHCLLHQHQPLLTTCPKCHSTINLPSRISKKREPFSCCCSYYFLKDNHLNILLDYWDKYIPSGFSNKSLEKVKWNVFPRDVSKVSTKALSMLYTDSSKYIFNRSLHKSFSKSLFDKDDLYCYKHREMVIENSCQNFISRLFSGKIISERYLRIFLNKILRTDINDIYNDEIICYLESRRRHQQLLKSLYRTVDLSDCYYDFLDDLIFYSSVNNAHHGSQNWLIYHFIQYLYSETLRQLIECDNLWQPFLYSFHHSEKEQKVHIKIQYNCYF